MRIVTIISEHSVSVQEDTLGLSGAREVNVYQDYINSGQISYGNYVLAINTIMCSLLTGNDAKHLTKGHISSNIIPIQLVCNDSISSNTIQTTVYFISTQSGTIIG